MLIVVIWTCVICIGIIFFQKSAGTLNPCKMNIVSISFYFILFQTILGALLTSLGFIKHYTYIRLDDAEKFTQMGEIYSALTFILFPIVIFTVLKIFKVNPKLDYDVYLKRKVDYEESKEYFIIILVAALVCSFFLIVLLKKIGYIPIIKMFFNNGMDLALERSKNVSLVIFEWEQIKNILVLYAIPILSFISFSFALVTNEIRWKILFVVLLIESILVKTYDFSKAPIVIYLAIMVLIVIYCKGSINHKILTIAGVAGVFMLVFAYRLVGYSGSFFDIYNGILGRTIFTQFGTLCMHFEAFTDYIGLLHGRSLYPTMLSILGMNPESHVRSAEIVMEVYNPEGIYEGNAGVMNTLFIGEAYANWGIAGVIFSIVWVALVIAVVFTLFIKLRKTPITVSFFAILTQQLTTGIQGGFVDYIYNSSIIMTIVCMILLHYYPNIIKRVIHKYQKKEA